MQKKCLYCKETFTKSKTTSVKEWNNTRKYCSRECRYRDMTNWKKEKANAWKGNKAAIISKHGWLINNYGSANKCENREQNILGFKCTCKSKKYHYALKKGKKYSHNRDNFLMLCVSCHKYYDFTEKARANLRRSHTTKEYRKKWKVIMDKRKQI